MEEQLVSFETAKLAKEKGFIEETYAHFDDKSGKEWNLNLLRNYNIPYSTAISRPTQALLQKWLREIHKLYIVIHIHKEGYSYNIHSIKNNREDKFLISTILESIASTKWINTYEEALEAGLLAALNLIK